MTILDSTVYAAMIKEHYADGVVQDRAVVAGGAHWNQPVGIALPSGGSSTMPSRELAIHMSASRTETDSL